MTTIKMSKTKKPDTYEEGKVLISMDEIQESLSFSKYRGWKLIPSPINAVFVIDRFIENMIDDED